MCKALIITPCTKTKKFTSDLKKNRIGALDAGDFYHNRTEKIDSLKNRSYECAAIEMYNGKLYGPFANGESGPIKKAIDYLRNKGAGFDHYFLSAGYGLIKSDEKIVPYDVSFNDTSEDFSSKTDNQCRNYIDWGRFLKVRPSFEKLIKDYKLIIILLAGRYTDVLELDKPLPLKKDQRVLYLDMKNRQINQDSALFRVLDPMDFKAFYNTNNLIIRGYVLNHLIQCADFANEKVFDYIYGRTVEDLAADLKKTRFAGLLSTGAQESSCGKKNAKQKIVKLKSNSSADTVFKKVKPDKGEITKKMTYSQIVSSFTANPRDVSTAPISNVQPKFFYVYVVAGSLYVSRAKTHKPSCSITNDRRLNEKEFEAILSIYHRREAGEKVGQEATNTTVNSVYWYGIFNDMKC